MDNSHTVTADESPGTTIGDETIVQCYYIEFFCVFQAVLRWKLVPQLVAIRKFEIFGLRNMPPSFYP